MENAEDEEEEEREEGEDNDDLINDILTSEEEEEEEEETTTIRKTKLVPIDAIDDTDQETLRSLSFNERNDDHHRKNIRRAPRGRMNSRRNEP